MITLSRKVLVEGPGCADIGCVTNISSAEWLFGNGSTLVWADSILISRVDYDAFERMRFLHDPVLQESVGVLISGLKREGVIKVVDHLSVMPKVSVDSVSEQVENDLMTYGAPASEPDENGKREPQHIEHEHSCFCPIVLESLYSSLLLSRFLGCSCLLYQSKKMFVENRFGGLLPASKAGLAVFSDYYTILLPNVGGKSRSIALCQQDRRDACTHGSECSSHAVKCAKKYLDALLVARNKPEIVALAEAVDKAEAELGNDKDAVSNALLKDINQAQRRVMDGYPRAQMWSRFTGYVSAAAFGASVSFGDCLGALLSGAVGLASVGVEVGADRFEKSARWKLSIAESIVNAPALYKESTQ